MGCRGPAQMMPIAIPVLLHLGASHCPRSCNAFTCDRRWCRACCACGGNCTLPAPEPPRPPVDQEHALLEILLESLTAMHAQHAPDLKKRSGVALGEFWLRNRAWEGGGHIGNRPAQASAYYDLVRAERERLLPRKVGAVLQGQLRVGMQAARRVRRE